MSKVNEFLFFINVRIMKVRKIKKHKLCQSPREFFAKVEYFIKFECDELDNLDIHWPRADGNKYSELRPLIREISIDVFNSLEPKTIDMELLLNSVLKIVLGIVYPIEGKNFIAGRETNPEKQIQLVYNYSKGYIKKLRLRQVVKTIQSHFDSNVKTLPNNISLPDSLIQKSNDLVRIVGQNDFNFKEFKKVTQNLYIQFFYIHMYRKNYSHKLADGYNGLSDIFQSKVKANKHVAKVIKKIKGKRFRTKVSELDLLRTIQLSAISNKEKKSFIKKELGEFRGGRPKSKPNKNNYSIAKQRKNSDNR